jgi:hypothetical protein
MYIVSSSNSRPCNFSPCVRYMAYSEREGGEGTGKEGGREGGREVVKVMQ